MTLDKTQVKLLSNFMSILLDKLSISLVTNYARKTRFFFFAFVYCICTVESCHGNIVISYVKLQIIAEISHQNEGVICHPCCYDNNCIRQVGPQIQIVWRFLEMADLETRIYYPRKLCKGK